MHCPASGCPPSAPQAPFSAKGCEASALWKVPHARMVSKARNTRCQLDNVGLKYFTQLKFFVPCKGASYLHLHLHHEFLYSIILYAAATIDGIPNPSFSLRRSTSTQIMWCTIVLNFKFLCNFVYSLQLLDVHVCLFKWCKLVLVE